MGCASSKNWIEQSGEKCFTSASSSEEGHATTKEEETEEKMSKLFDCASENHPSQAILDETRAKDVLYVYLQSFRLKEDESKKNRLKTRTKDHAVERIQVRTDDAEENGRREEIKTQTTRVVQIQNQS